MERNTQKRCLSFAARVSLLFVSFAISLFSLTAVSANQQININSATAQELESLPGIGPALAKRIIEHREKHGPFKRPQDVIIVRGMSARRFRQIAHLIEAKSRQD